MTRATREVIVAANWKMNTTPSEAGRLAIEIAQRTRGDGVTRIICPPFVSLAAVREAVAGDGIAIGAQNVHDQLMGAFTGEVSAPMLVGLAEWVIVGHSERRRDAGETDELVGRKVDRVLEAGLRPIMCVGEQLAEREAGRAMDVVDDQIRRSLAVYTGEPNRGRDLVVAYEPVWAIGTGRTARGSDAAAMAELIRGTLAEIGWPSAESIPVLYGGSVTAASIGEFLAEPALDGALVGGASLKPDEMAGIVGQAGVVAHERLVAANR